jgi:hypothetical protein
MTVYDDMLLAGFGQLIKVAEELLAQSETKK